MDSSELIIKPNESLIVPISEEYSEIIKELLNDEESIYECRTIVQDENGYGIILPTKILEEGFVVVLPEQLCIFVEENTYFIKIELMLETQVITAHFGPCKIDLNDLYGQEEEQDGQDEEEEDNKPQKASEEEIEDDLELDHILDVVAPVKKLEIKKTKVEDIAKQLDEEFVRNALWQNKRNNVTEQKVMAPVSVPTAEPLLNNDQLVVKDKLKNLMKKMLS